MIRKLAIRFAAVIAASCSIGLSVNVTTYRADGDLGVYVAGFGLERASGDVLPSLWLCDDDISWHCPTVKGPGVRERRSVPLVNWQPLTVSHMIWLAMNVDADRDWSACKAAFADVMIVHCGDGFEVTV